MNTLCHWTIWLLNKNVEVPVVFSPAGLHTTIGVPVIVGTSQEGTVDHDTAVAPPVVKNTRPMASLILQIAAISAIFDALQGSAHH